MRGGYVSLSEAEQPLDESKPDWRQKALAAEKAKKRIRLGVSVPSGHGMTAVLGLPSCLGGLQRVVEQLPWERVLVIGLEMLCGCLLQTTMRPFC